MTRWYHALAAALLAASPHLVQAQEGIVAGVVSAAGSDAPLPSVQVFVVGQTARTLTDERGRFRLSNVSGGTVTLEARRIGYRSSQVTARTGSLNVRIVMTTNPLSLEAVVITGTAGATEKRAIGNSVTTVDAAAVTELAPINSVQGLLNGRAPGVVVQPATGAVGTGGRIRVRGNASFSLSNEPLLYVDGVRLNNNPSSGPANQAFGSSSISRINDINPDDIESIEILKGPAAAALYGTEASNGVIQVITKKGRSGEARWNAITRQGVNYLRDYRDRFFTNYGMVDGKLQSVTVRQLEDTLAAYGYDRNIFRTGRRQETEASVTGGTDRFSYFVSGTYLDDAGAEPSNYQRRASGRVNIGLSPTERIRVNVNSGYISGPTYLSAEAGYGGRVWTLVSAAPQNFSSPFKLGFHSALPAQYDSVYNFLQAIGRLTSSVRIEHTPATWFTHRLTAGIDRSNEENVVFVPRIDALTRSPSFGSEALGSKDVIVRDVTYRTLDYSGTATTDLGRSLRLGTSIGAQYYRDRSHYTEAYGEIFPTPGLNSVNATTTNRLNGEDFVENATLGIYGQEQLSIGDRLFVTGAVRSDNSSAFGRNFNRAVYPKLSVSYVISEEPFFKRYSALTELRLRAAYGEAGKAPATYAALRTFAPVPGPGDQPAVTPQFLGNANLGPERGKEIELGLDASAFGDRLGGELTYYRKRTTNAILDRDITPSIGFSGTQPFNAGAIRNSGIEALVRATPYRGRIATFDATASIATNANVVEDLGTPGLKFVTAGTYIRHAVGFPAGGWWEQRVLSGTRDANGAISLLCDNGAGGSQPCAGADGRFGTADDAPDVYLGRSTPPTEGAVSGTLTLWDRLRLYSLFDFQRGWKKLDGNYRVRCTFFSRCRENFVPNDYDPVIIGQIQSNRNLVDLLIRDASFTKFREFTVSYQVPDVWASRLRSSKLNLALSGRNLHTWTSYEGLEPEAMFNGGSRGGFAAWEQTTLPQLTQWIASINVTF